MVIKRIGVLTGGGDCPGLNPALKWVVKTAMDPELADKRGYQFEVIGIKDGWKGLVKHDKRKGVLPARTEFGEQDFARILVPEETRTWDRMGGTRLGTSRTNPFNPKNPTYPQVLENIEALGLHALVAIGGEDTLSIASRLSEMGVNVVAIPKTIDRDLQGTDYSLGFETAVNVIVEEIDRIRTTARSHSRTFVVEAMGRYAGHLALSGGIASGASMILIPEVPYRIDRVVQLLKQRQEEGHRFSIIVVAEGTQEDGGTRIERKADANDQYEHPTLGGIGDVLAHQIEAAMGLETRAVNLSHLQRGGIPCAYDRRMGRLFGIGAVDLVVKEQFGRMVAIREGKLDSIPIPRDLKNVRLVDVAKRYDTERYTAKYSVLVD